MKTNLGYYFVSKEVRLVTMIGRVLPRCSIDLGSEA